MLEHAPRSAVAGRLIRGLILLFLLISSAGGIVAHHPSGNAWVVYAICGFLGLVVVYSFSRFPPLSDRWAMSRLVGYEGDSPQDLQDRIDALQAEAAASRFDCDHP